MRIQNYGRPWSFTPREIARPATVDELAQIIKAATKLRPVGSRHSWSKGIVTNEVLVSIENLNRIYEIDETHLKVKVGAGIILKELMTALNSKAWH